MTQEHIENLIRAVGYFMTFGAGKPDNHEPRTNFDAVIEAYNAIDKTSLSEYERQALNLDFAKSYRSRGRAFDWIKPQTWPAFKKERDK